MTVEKARKLLRAAGVFFDNQQCLNLNDAFCWATVDGEDVPDEELPRVADLFWRYGHCGILYWVSDRRGLGDVEFADVNRFIAFVRQEELLRAKVTAAVKQEFSEPS